MNGGEDGACQERFTGPRLVGVEDEEGETVDDVVQELAEHGGDDGSHGAAGAVVKVPTVQREVCEDVQELAGDGFRGIILVPVDGDAVYGVDLGVGVVTDGGGNKAGLCVGGAGCEDGEADGGDVFDERCTVSELVAFEDDSALGGGEGGAGV